MKPGQEAIYTITGDDLAALRNSPHLEGLRRQRRRGAVADRPDRRVLAERRSAAYKEKPFKPVTQGAADLAKIEQPADRGGSPPSHPPNWRP